MKKIMIFAFTAVFTLGMQAQQGAWWAGGTVGFGGTSNTDQTSNPGPKISNSLWAFSPDVNYFLTEKIQVGVALGLVGSTNKSAGNKTSSSSGFSPTLYARYYMPINDVLSVYSGLNIHIITGSNTNYNTGGDPNDQKTKFSGFGVTADCGLAFALSNRLTALTKFGIVGFTSQTDKDVNGEKVNTTSNYGFLVNGFGPVFNFGIFYTFLGGN